MSEPTYTYEELKNIDPPPFTYEGKTYTAYEATQQQRKMERFMRRQKDHCIASDAAGDKDSFTTASIKLRRQNEIYKDFSEKAGLYTQYERTQVQGFGRSISSKATWAVRKAEEMENAQIRLTSDNNRGIIQSKNFIKGNYNPIFSNSADAKRVNPTLAIDFSNQIAKATKVFGNISSLKSIAIMPNNEYPGAWGRFIEEQGQIRLKLIGGKHSIEELSDLAKKMKNDGQWSTSSFLHVYRHELGHAIQHSMKTSNPDLWSRKEMRIKDIYNNIINECKNEPTFKDMNKKAGEYLSAYGLTDIDEFISESIAEYMNGNSRQTAKNVVNILLEEE